MDSISLSKAMEIIKPIALLLAALAAGYLSRKMIFNRILELTKRTKTQIDDVVISAVKGPWIAWFLMAGTYAALKFSNLPEKAVDLSGKGLLALGLISVSLVLANIVSELIKIYSSQLSASVPVTSLTSNASRIIIIGMGVLIVLNTLGITITPILATLGVGGLAVALALQDSMANLFAGFHILASRQVRVGDYIKLDTGDEGYVIDITWRSTKIRTLPNNIILVPNAKLTQAVITNFYFPDKELAVLVNVGVHYKSDLEKVEKVTCDVARQTLKEVQGGASSFEPFIRYNALGDFSIQFTVILRAKEFVDQYLIKHEFIKRLHARYIKEGIEIPYPTRTINYEKKEGTA